ncbi:MAG: hypothetical protein K8963_02825, partial [Proteobacteria bacterium]|nr:hypothetical protein [Pseudomonadota bacterium]
NAIFDGNGFVIANIAVVRAIVDLGVFGATGANAVIRNLGLTNNLTDYPGSDHGEIYVGGLVGNQLGGSIIACYTTGVTDGGNDRDTRAGGLVGLSNALIIASFTTGTTYSGFSGSANNVGGLVGLQQANGTITASYASGDVIGGTASDNLGGLIGRQFLGLATASYASGDVDARTGDGLAATVHPFLGLMGMGTVIDSYGFGLATNADTTTNQGNPPAGVTTASALTATNAGATWNNATSNTLGAWDFGSTSQEPTLRYADYDGPGDVYTCAIFPPNTCNTPIPNQ